MTILSTFSLTGKVALITGGAGLYGKQIVRAVAEAGARTYIASRSLAPLEALAAEHRKQGHDVRAQQLDQADEKSILALRDAIVKDSGRLDILVNNAVARPVKKGHFDDAAAIDVVFQEIAAVVAAGGDGTSHLRGPVAHSGFRRLAG